MKRFTKSFGLVCLLTIFPPASSAEVAGFTVYDASLNVQGGVDQGFTGRALVGISFDYSLTKNWSFYAEAQLQRGDNGSLKVGDIQAYSNIDEADFSKLYELWFEGHFINNKLRIKFGQIDANTEFAFADNAGEFINSSMGFSPTIGFLPTYPDPTMGITAFYKLNDDLTSAVGIFSDENNQFDDQFVIGEGQFKFDDVLFKVGVWQWHSPLVIFNDAKTKQQTSGGYLVVEGAFNWQLFSSSSAGWFLQAGVSDDQLSELDTHLGLGVVWNDLLVREGDLLGFGVTHVTTSKFLRNELASSETAFELFYKYQWSDYLSLKPDLQFILSPAVQRETDNALVATLRIEVSF